jgi:ribosomal protein S16
LNEARVKYWHDRGAQASDTVRNLLKAAGAWPRIIARS